MIVYHIDRSFNLKEGQVIELDKEYFKNIPHLEEPMGRYFPDGVSYHGKSMTSNSATNSINNIRLPIIEPFFEMVRLKSFPTMPSRYQVLFAVDYLKDIELWKADMLAKNVPFKVFEIEVHKSSMLRLDARWLDYGIEQTNDSLSLEPHTLMANAYQYWAKKSHKQPKHEVLLSLPVTIGKEVNYSV